MRPFLSLTASALVAACAAGCASSDSDDSGPVCSNAVVEQNEECDDGNTTSGDGCSSTCGREWGWDCSDGACTTVCGDRIRAGEEACDTASSPGYCSEDCTHIIGSCGDGVVQTDASETCDKGNGSVRGCSDLCRDRFGFKCDAQKNSCTGSGLPGDKVASTLTDAELSQYCSWLVGLLGGEGHVWECAGYQITNNSVATCAAKQKDSWGDMGKCTIRQIEDFFANAGGPCSVWTSSAPSC